MQPRNQFAPVATLPIYEGLAASGDLGSYQLLIATEVVKDLEGWSNFWDCEVRGEQFIIMDNGLIETGSSADPSILIDASTAVGASCMVLPDTLGDFQATYRQVIRSMDSYRQLNLPLMGVVQGQNVTEVEEILQLYVRGGVEYLSIPRVMVEFFGTRRWLVERARWYQKPIHLLGWSENVEDDLQCAAMDGVMGIDSAVPIWWDSFMPSQPPQTSNFGKRPANYWSDTDYDINFVQGNVRWTRRWIEQYATDARLAAGALAPEVPETQPFA